MCVAIERRECSDREERECVSSDRESFRERERERLKRERERD